MHVSMDSWTEPVFFHLVNPRGQTQVLSLVGKHPSLLTYLTGTEEVLFLYTFSKRTMKWFFLKELHKRKENGGIT